MKEQLFQEPKKYEKQDEEEFRLYEQHIENYHHYIKYAKITSMITFLIFLVLFTINISINNSGYWFYIFSPALISVISTSIFLNYILKIQNTLK